MGRRRRPCRRRKGRAGADRVSGWLEHQAGHRRRDAEGLRVPAPAPSTTRTSCVKMNFPEDMWVVAAEMRPGNPKVLHHGKVLVRPPGSNWMKDAVRRGVRDRTQRDEHRHDAQKKATRSSASSIPVSGAQRFDQCESREVRAEGIGSRLRNALHDDRKPATDRSKLGLVLAKQAPRRATISTPARRPSTSRFRRRRQCRSRQRR